MLVIKQCNSFCIGLKVQDKWEKLESSIKTAFLSEINNYLKKYFHTQLEQRIT